MGLFAAKPSANAQKIIDWLGCPCEYFPAGKPAQLIQSAYEEAFARREMDGITPVIIVADDVLSEQLDMVKEQFLPGESIRQYRSRILNGVLPDARQWFTQKLSEMKESLGEYWNEITADTGNAGGSINKLSGFIDQGNKRCRETVLAKIPAADPWEIFAWLPFGGWNECPDTEVMISVSRYWHEKYHAFPAVIAHDVLEFAAVPVPDRSAAVGLALEQYAFCGDIVDQGFQELCVLADTLTKSSVWYFWWD